MKKNQVFHLLFVCILASCATSTRQPNSLLPSKLRFSDNEELRIVRDASAVGAGIGLGIGFGIGGNRNTNIGLSSLGGIMGGMVGKKQANEIKSLKLKSSQLERLVSAADRRTNELAAYNKRLKSSISTINNSAVTISNKTAYHEKLRQQSNQALQNADERISFLHTAVNKSIAGQQSLILKQSTDRLVAERNRLHNQTKMLATLSE